jgi:hypothetical protein
MADCSSHMFHLTYSKLFSYFKSHFHQTMPWQLCQLHKETRSALISALRRKISKLALLINVPKHRRRIGFSGRSFQNNIDPFLRKCNDPVPIIQVFYQRYHDGIIAPHHNAIRSDTVTDAIRSVGKTITRLGATDIRKGAISNIDFRIYRQFRAYTKEDDPLRE